VSSPTGLLSSILKVIHELYLCMDVARLAPGLVKILIDLVRDLLALPRSYPLGFPLSLLSIFLSALNKHLLPTPL